MKFAKSVLAISVALAMSGAAGAATKKGDDDSVRQWGRWAVLMPAAGDVTEHPVEPRIAGRDFRPEDAEQYERVANAPERQETPREEPRYEGMCQAGASCGYATYEYRYYTSGYDGYGGEGGYGGYYSDGGEGAPVPAGMKANVQFPAVDSVQVAAIGTPPGDGGEAGVIADFSVTPHSQHPNYPPVTDRHAEEDHIHDYGDGSVYWHAENDTDTSPDGGEGYTRVRIDGVMVPELIENTTAGWWSEGEYSYHDYYTYEEFERGGSYVAGTATGLAFLESLNAGNVEARYVGFAMDSQVDVVIDMDFGADTWSGSWNGGRDGSVYTFTDENGQNYVRGEVGFNASGYISGPNIVSTSISASDAESIAGRVDGSLFGSEAQVLGGLSDITKTVSEATVGEGGTVYDAARNVDTFVTVEESIADQVMGSDAFLDE